MSGRRLPVLRPRRIEEFEDFDFTHARRTRRVLRSGTGLGVLLLHELPGMTPECITLAKSIVASPFTVHLPLMVGEPGQSHALLNTFRLCVSSQIALFAAEGRSKITDWLRAFPHQADAYLAGFFGSAAAGFRCNS